MKGKLVLLSDLLSPYIKEYTFRLIFVLVLFAISMLLTVLIPWISKVMVNGVFYYEMSTLLGLSISLLFSYVFSALARYWASVSYSKVGMNILLKVKKSLIDHLLELPMDFFERYDVGYINQRLAEVDGLRNLFSLQFFYSVFGLFKLFVSLILLYFLHFYFFVLALIGVPVLIFVVSSLMTSYRITVRQSVEASAKSRGWINQMLVGINDLKLFNNTYLYTKIYNTLVDVYSKRFMKEIVSSLSHLKITISRGILTVVTLVVGIILLKKGEIKFGDYIAASMYISYVYEGGASIATISMSLQPILVIAERIKDLFDLIIEEDEWGVYKKENIVGDIIIKDLSFKYDSGASVFNNFSAHILGRKLNIIVGANGSGKTTLLKLLLGYYRTYEGLILLDGVDLREYDVKWLRKRIAVVSQNVVLFEGSVWENITLGENIEYENEVMSIIQRLHIREYVTKDIYAPFIREFGKNLSGGQKKLIALARALVKDADVYIFDEADASLDVQIEKLLWDIMLNDLSCKTRIVVTHKLSMIDNFFSGDDIHIINLGLKKVGEG